jgi:hypothetical protein
MDGDAAIIMFDLKAGTLWISNDKFELLVYWHVKNVVILEDFRPLWTWNTKQLFIYVVITYENDAHVRSSVIMLFVVDHWNLNVCCISNWLSL